jgi:hypothetical protein
MKAPRDLKVHIEEKKALHLKSMKTSSTTDPNEKMRVLKLKNGRVHTSLSISLR